jgi:acyl dehydratase
VFIFIRLTSGVLAGLLVRGHGYDVIGDIAVGVIYDCTTYLEPPPPGNTQTAAVKLPGR